MALQNNFSRNKNLIHFKSTSCNSFFNGNNENPVFFVKDGLARTRNFLDDPFGLVRPKCKTIRQVEKVERPYLTDAMALIRPRLSGCHRQNTYCTRCGRCHRYTQRGDACLSPHL